MNSELAASALDARHYDVLLSATPRGARLARLLAVEQLRGWGLPLDAPRAIVAELAVNAVTHGRVPGRGFRMELLARPGVLRIEVADTRGDRLPVLCARGRGLVLVDAFADRWGVREGPAPGKVVWAEVSWGAATWRASPKPSSARGTSGS
ncbi:MULTISPECIES: ATP-binding protein [unclassified Streptomyces]|uniref:ATP-binding protein n=1 Tax=unclassified Streptomyces TaxID=2593676 RepID=UPI002E37EF1C|nr:MULTISPECIES: ATP-binding protein [unclassified Streptomyces]WUC66021.1 ATP-binding protein [Streptomyces sp. NBC_00539]